MIIMRLTYQTALFLTTLWIIFLQGEVIIEKIICKSFDEERVKFVKCGMKMVPPGKPKLAIIHAQLLEPVYSCTIKMQFLKKSNNQIYNNYLVKAMQIDACKFMEYKERSMLVNYVYQFVAPFTNINHSCPYMGDIYLRNFKVEQQNLTNLPIPEGEYAFYTAWNSSKRLLVDIKMFLTVR